jgi:hypothetical protein
MIDQKLRISEAGLALIVRKGLQREHCYLTQWNDKWQAYSFVEDFGILAVPPHSGELRLQVGEERDVAAVRQNAGCEQTWPFPRTLASCGYRLVKNEM